MAQDSKNHRSGHLFRLPPRWRLILWPVVTLSGGGSVAALWMQEEAILLVDCAPIAAIPGLAALLYWFNHQLFKASMPRPDDLKTPSNRNNPHGKKD
jgi:hypothetical protein